MTKMGRFTITAQIITYYLEIGLSCYLLIFHLDYLSWPWLFLVGLLTCSSIMVNIASGVRISFTMDFYKKKCGLFLCTLVHFLQLGPLWRYLKLLSIYDPSDFSDLMKLKLLHCFVFSTPITLYLAQKLMADSIDIHLLMMVFVSYASIVVTLTHFSDFSGKETSGYVMSVCSFLWRLFMLFSRLSALTWVLSSPHSMWVILVLGIHYLILVIWYQLRETSDENDCTPFRVWLTLLALANTLDLTISDYQVSIEWLTGFYALSLSENVAMIAIWYSSANETNDHQLTLWLVVIFTSFALGLLFAMATLTLKNHESTRTALQHFLQCCCPGSKRNQSCDGALIWDSYDVKRKKASYYTNKAFDIEERQKHVEIINNPLGITSKDVVSLSTHTGPRSPMQLSDHPSHHKANASPVAKLSPPTEV